MKTSKVPEAQMNQVPSILSFREDALRGDTVDLAELGTGERFDDDDAFGLIETGKMLLDMSANAYLHERGV